MSAEPEKPEWFKMTEADKAPLPRKRGLRAAALAIPLLMVGAGFVVAQSQNPPAVTATASAAQTPAVQSTPPGSANTSQPTATPASTPAIGTVPPIKLPTSKGDEGLEGNDD
jgi:hypothetical protein